MPELRRERAALGGDASGNAAPAPPGRGTSAAVMAPSAAPLWVASEGGTAPAADDRADLMGREFAIPESVGLSEAGQPMPDLVIDPHDADIAVTVDIGDEVPLASYVMAHTPAGLSLQRTSPGLWEPWDGQPESLVDNGFRPTAGWMTFEIMEGDLSEEFFPMTFTVAYQTKDALKYGVFQAMPDQQDAP